MDGQPLGSSFRDPSGFVFTRSGVVYRQVNRVFQQEFEAVAGSGLYDELAGQRLMVPHESVSLDLAASPEATAVLRPEPVHFISYPYEWSFGQLQDAALLTLELQERALGRGMTLRDASAYNVQFQGGRPVFIDTLSFEPRKEGAPWSGVPAVLRALPGAARAHEPGGHRPERAAADAHRRHPARARQHLLGGRVWRSLGLLFHVRLHAMAQRRYRDRTPGAGVRRPVTAQTVQGLVRSLRSVVQGLDWNPGGTEWADYTTDNNYSAEAAEAKQALVTGMLRRRSPATVWDLGANTGEYSRAARTVASRVVSFDIDPAAVERNYRRVRADGESGILPLRMDLTNPSPALGWAHRERQSLEQRGPADALLALALVHHLAIGHNLPLERIAGFFARIGRALVIEFVPKSDSQVQRMLRSRPDIFPSYTREGFEAAFRTSFRIEAVEPVSGSERLLYLMVPLQS